MSDDIATLEEFITTLDLLEEGGIPPSISEEIKELIRIGYIVKYNKSEPRPEDYIRWRPAVGALTPDCYVRWRSEIDPDQAVR